ncbi:MAG: metallophosphoesterase [Clostridia bacterium]|nr:metallophosphoesterase [Clostridia bacterium]
MKYCISDMHGEYDMTLRLLEEIGFSNEDTLIVVGDIIDKGEASIKLANYIFSLPNSICVLGNHEYDFLKRYRAMTREDGVDFDFVLDELRKQFPQDGKYLTWDTMENFETMLDYYEDDELICVHAGVPLDTDGSILPLSSAFAEQLVYDRTFKNPDTRVVSDRCVIYGHTPTCAITNDYRIIKYHRTNMSLGEPSISDFSRVHIDTGVYLTNTLGCFCVDTCECFYVRR